jgi:hypothetical protein
VEEMVQDIFARTRSLISFKQRNRPKSLRNVAPTELFAFVVKHLSKCNRQQTFSSQSATTIPLPTDIRPTPFERCSSLVQTAFNRCKRAALPLNIPS